LNGLTCLELKCLEEIADKLAGISEIIRIKRDEVGGERYGQGIHQGDGFGNG
jgi:hypothetical protein